ncbi:hypothetical protein RI367_002592 [Sorochytrium milnesiophthora]
MTSSFFATRMAVLATILILSTAVPGQLAQADSKACWAGDLALGPWIQPTRLTSNAGYFTIALQRPPKCDATLYLESDIELSTCTLLFTQQNWNISQTVQFSASQAASQAAKVTVTYAGCAGDAQSGQQAAVSWPWSVSDNIRGLGCYTQGDSDLTTFQGHDVAFTGAGDYYYLQSDLVSVQARYIQGGNSSAACVSAVAIRYGDSVITIDSGSTTTDAVQRTIPTIHHFALNGNGLISVEMNAGSPGIRSVSIVAGDDTAHPRTGLCQAADNSDAWRVPDHDNLFKCHENCDTVQNYPRGHTGISPFSICTIPRPSGPNPESSFYRFL